MEKHGIVGTSSQVQHIRDFIDKVSHSHLSVLIEGESGTGKELVANAIHMAGSRKDASFVAINCGSMPKDLLENELFGHEPGAFSGANTSKRGLFEIADKGTLFIDEIGEMDIASQVKLLRVLETGKFMRLGGVKELSSDVRVVAATNRILEHEIENGNFRRDLYYRLCVLRLYVPALRERKSDIKELINYFLGLNKSEKTFDERAVSMLENYYWPGNVRELKNIIDRVNVMAEESIITPDTIAGEIKTTPQAKKHHIEINDNSTDQSFDRFVEIAEKDFLIRANEKYGGNKVEMAKVLKISRDKLYRKLRQYDIK